MSATFTDLATGQPVTAEGEVAASDATPGRKSEMRSVAWRLKHCAAPPAAVAAIACAGALGQIGARPALVSAGTYIVVAVLLLLRAERKAGKGSRRSRRRSQQRTYRIVVSAAGLVWVLWADATSAAGWRGVALAVGAYALTGLGVLLFGSKIPNPAANKAPSLPAPTAAVADSEATRLVMDWARYIGCPSGPIPGSTITPTEAWDTDTGAKAYLHLVKGRHSIETVRGYLPLLRTGLGYADVTVEGDDRGIDPDPAVVLLTVVKRSRSVTVEEIPWSGPALNLHTGRIDVGPYSDGQSVAEYTLLTENSLWGGFIVGAIGSGKSSLTLNVALSAASSGLVSVISADPGVEASMPELSQWAHMTARGVDQIEELFELLAEGIKFRRMENSAYGWRGFDPVNQGRPGVLVVVHECHLAFARPSIRKNAELIAREGRKFGFAVLAETQDATLDAFGGSDALRDALCAKNVIAMNTQSDNPMGCLNNLAGNPVTLPKLPGFAFGGPGCRPVHFRARNVREEDRWTERIAQVEFDTGVQNMLGPAYTEWKDFAAEYEAWNREFVAAVTSGLTPPPKPERKKITVTAEEVAATPMTGGGSLLVLPTLRATGPRVPAKDRIVELLRQGVVGTNNLAELADVSDETVRKVCDKLVTEGAATKLGSGHWALVEVAS